MRTFIFIIFAILVSSSCKLNKKNKKEYFYFDNGNLESEHFVNDKGDFDGKIIVYYRSGKKRYVAEYKNGEQIGIYRGFDENGRLRHFAISDIIGETMYVIKWDSLGYKIKEEGMVISPNFVCLICGKGNTVKKNVPMLVNTSAAIIPNATTKVEFGVLNSKNKLLDLYNLEIEKLNILPFEYTFKDTGTYTLFVRGWIHENKTNRLIKFDSIPKQIRVL